MIFYLAKKHDFRLASKRAMSTFVVDNIFLACRLNYEVMHG